MDRRKRTLLGAGIVLLVAIVAWVGPVVRDVVGAGFLEKPMRNEYRAGREENLRAIYTALSLYHQSEDRYPDAAGWMDAIEPRLKTNDLSEADAKRKLVRPDLAKTPGAFGYAIAEGAAGRYRGEVKGERILVYESTATARNAVGKPERGRMAVDVEGRVRTL